MRSRFNTVYVTKESKLTGDEFFVGVSVGVSVGVLVIRGSVKSCRNEGSVVRVGRKI